MSKYSRWSTEQQDFLYEYEDRIWSEICYHNDICENFFEILEQYKGVEGESNE